MTKSQKILEAEKAFYAWTPGEPRPAVVFRCLHSKSNQCMTEVMCQARAGNPGLFRDVCSGGTPKCPRWKYYRKMLKKAKGLANDKDCFVRRAYK